MHNIKKIKIDLSTVEIVGFFKRLNTTLSKTFRPSDI